MAEYIEREAAYEKCGWYNTVNGKSVCAVRKDELAAIPVADVASVVHAEWRHLGGDEWCCTHCAEVIHTEGSWETPDKHFCYECGA